MKYYEQITKIRRFLRDPDKNIWTDSFLKTAFNDTQRELAHLLKHIEDVDVIRVPPLYQISYQYDWEYQNLDQTETHFYHCCQYLEQSEYVSTYRWEIQVLAGFTGLNNDAGARITQPWEAWVSDPNDVIPLKLPVQFHTTRFLAYDNEPLPYTDKKDIMYRDTQYQTRSGKPIAYYRENSLDNEIIIYPRPSSASWDDIIGETFPSVVYSQSWESDYLTGEQFTKIGDNYNYLFYWEVDGVTADVMRGMFVFELDYSISGEYGQVNYYEGDTNDSDLGVITSRTGSLFTDNVGLAVDVLETDENFLIVYDSLSEDISSEADESGFPEFLQKYLEFGVLARAYHANTDGRIKSLADYWNIRFDLGKQSISRYASRRMQDRDYRLMTKQTPPARTRRHPRLPDTYPVI